MKFKSLKEAWEYLYRLGLVNSFIPPQSNSLMPLGITNIEVFTASGTFTPNFSGIVLAIVSAGGGGGGGGAYGSCTSAGGGGGAGGFATVNIQVYKGHTYSITVGAGGSGGAGGTSSSTAGSTGGTGGTTIIEDTTTGTTLITTTGGAGGTGASSSGNGAPGTNGSVSQTNVLPPIVVSTAVFGNINITNASTGSGASIYSNNLFFGQGGVNPSGCHAGTSAAGFGAGGGGGTGSTSAGYQGGNGALGIVILMW